MKFELISDIHLNDNIFISTDFFEPKSDILVLAGDICEYHEIPKYYEFFEKISKNWKHVLYVLGNHEFYCGQVNKVSNVIRHNLKELKNIVVLDNEIITIDNVCFIGSTLWASMFNGYDKCMSVCTKQINDFKYIISESPPERISDIQVLKLFHDNVDFIQTTLDNINNKKIVVITHFSPSLMSIHPKFSGNIINGYFCNDLDYMITNDSRIKVWCHGHTHDKFDYQINKCRVVCNPLGYRNNQYYYPQLIQL